MAKKKPEYRIVKTYKDYRSVQYLMDHFTNDFVPAYKRGHCPTFPKKRAEQIVSRLKTKIPPGWESRIEISMEIAD